MVKNVTGLDDLPKEREAREGEEKSLGKDKLRSHPPLPLSPPFLQTAISIELFSF